MITPLSEIKYLVDEGQLSSHITEPGGVYIPRRLGGVDVSIATSPSIRIEIRSTDAEWKAYHYVGVSAVAPLFKGRHDRTFAITLRQDGDMFYYDSAEG